MREFKSLSHTRWECKYHIVFIPKFRRRIFYGQLRKELGTVFHDLAGQRDCQIEEGHIMPDHVHMLLAIPPKYSVSQVVGYTKGKSAIHIASNVRWAQAEFCGSVFLGAGLFCFNRG